MASRLSRLALWWAVFLTCLLPLGWLVLDGLQGALEPNAVEAVLHRTGDWALRFLLITLAITPLRLLTGSPAWLRWRRMLGLYSFFYALLHLLTWAWLDQQWYLDDMLADVVERPFITLGFTAVVLLVPLAVTSNRFAMRKLGRNWQRLHRLVYLIGVLGVIHYLWLVKADWAEPALYGLVLGIMLVLRLGPVKQWITRLRQNSGVRQTAR